MNSTLTPVTGFEHGKTCIWCEARENAQVVTSKRGKIRNHLTGAKRGKTRDKREKRVTSDVYQIIIMLGFVRHCLTGLHLHSEGLEHVE